MHPRNIYNKPTNFEDLAKAYPPLIEYLVPSNPPSQWKTINFHNESAQRCLTQALLHRDFHIKLKLPENRLCPPIPNRLNYVLWIQDIVRAHRFLFSEDIRTIRGIDIGTGASAIYPLLACKMEPRWNFIATEIDEKSYAYADRNIRANKMQDRIHLMRASSKKPILSPLEEYSGPPVDFLMCNPPFYTSKAEMSRSADMKEWGPNAVCTGSDLEMIYAAGGEAAFVGQMIDESERHNLKCRWYTSMLGKQSSLNEIIMMFRKRPAIRTYAITEFVQGHTRRWAVAWSYTNEHLPDTLARYPVHPQHSVYPLLPMRNTLNNSFSISFNAIDAVYLQTALLGVCSMAHVTAAERALILEDDPNEPLSFFRLHPILLTAHKNTWSRRERRKLQQQQQQQQIQQQASTSSYHSQYSHQSYPSTSTSSGSHSRSISHSMSHSSYSSTLHPVSQSSSSSHRPPPHQGSNQNSMMVDGHSHGHNHREREREIEREYQLQLQLQRERERSLSPPSHNRVPLMVSMQWSFDLSITPAQVILESQWVFGDDRHMFESLVGHVVRKLVLALEPYTLTDDGATTFGGADTSGAGVGVGVGGSGSGSGFVAVSTSAGVGASNSTSTFGGSSYTSGSGSSTIGGGIGGNRNVPSTSFRSTSEYQRPGGMMVDQPLVDPVIGVRDMDM